MPTCTTPWWRSAYVRWPYGEPELAAEALCGHDRRRRRRSRVLSGCPCRGARRVRGVGRHAVCRVDQLARARLLDTLVELTEDGQRVTFGSRQ